MTRLLAFAGSARARSLNKRLAGAAAAAARAAGAEVTLLDLREHPLPLYDGDLEERDGLPANAVAIKRLMLEHDGFVIASPEYNSSISPLLKNVIDWASRQADGEPPLVAFGGKVALLLAASPGALGGLRGLAHVRSILSSIGVLVLPEQLAVPRAHEAFAADGALLDAKLADNLARMTARLVDVAGRLAR